MGMNELDIRIAELKEEIAQLNGTDNEKLAELTTQLGELEIQKVIVQDMKKKKA